MCSEGVYCEHEAREKFDLTSAAVRRIVPGTGKIRARQRLKSAETHGVSRACTVRYLREFAYTLALVGSTILTASERGYAICMVVEHKIIASASDSDSESDID